MGVNKLTDLHWIAGANQPRKAVHLEENKNSDFKLLLSNDHISKHGKCYGSISKQKI